MVDPISGSWQPLIWPSFESEEVLSQPPLPKISTKEAEAEVAALNYYTSTLTSMKNLDTSSTQQKLLTSVENQKPEKSLIRKAGEWLWGIFGGKKTEAVDSIEEASQPSSGPTLDRIPKLEKPDQTESLKLSELIKELNNELMARDKALAEFEIVVRKLNPQQVDSFIFLQLIASNLDQKKLIEDSSILLYEDLLDLNKHNRDIHRISYAIENAVLDRAKTQKNLQWINVGLTGGIVATMAISYATGGLGAFLMAGMPAMNFTKSGMSIAQEFYRRNMDAKKGDLFVINQISKTTSKKIDDRMVSMQGNDEDMGHLLKSLRRLLDDEYKTSRAFFGRV